MGLEAQIRVGEFNLGGITTSEMHTAEIVNTFGLDILLASETHVPYHNTLKTVGDRQGWKILNSARERKVKKDGRPAMAKGGVAVINTNPKKFAMLLHGSDSRGLIAAEVRERSGLFKPYLMIAVYLPPVDSTHAGVRDALLAKVVSTIQRAAPKYKDRIVLGGDFNASLPKLYGKARHTEDTSTARAGGSGRIWQALVDALEGTHMAPCTGREAASTARVNSRSVSAAGKPPGQDEGTEACYLALHKDADNFHSIDAEVTSEELWRLAGSASSHIPQSVAINMELAGTQIPEPQIGGKPQRWEHHTYMQKEAWGKVAGEAAPAMAAISDQLSSLPTAREAAQLWIDTYEGALDRAIPCKTTARNQGGTTGTQTWSPPSKRREAGKAIARRKHAALNWGRTLPRAVVDAIKNAQRKGASPADEKAARQALRNHNNALRKRDAWGINDIRRTDAKKFWKQLTEHLAPGDVTTHAHAEPIPHEDGQDPPLLRMTKQFTHVMGAAAPPPPGMSSEEWGKWVREVPEGEHAELGRKIEPIEVLLAIWPNTSGLRYMRCPANGKVAQGPDCCRLCHDIHMAAARYEGRGDTLNEPPAFSPRGKPQARINGDIQTSHLAWARPLDGNHLEKLAYQLHMATSISLVLNRFLSEGAVPREDAENLSVPILKSGTANKADPNGYRFTAMTGILLKTMDLVITARITHHAQRVGAISPKHQGAFTAGMSTEWHPWAVRELTMDAWRRKKNVFMVFIDFNKAYDRVHPEALLRVLERQGVPSNLRDFIRAWFAARSTRVRVNGELSDPIDTPGGLGQGNISSPALFSLFINSLSMFLESKGEQLGVSVGEAPNSTRVVSLAFADDINCPTETPEKAQEVLRLVEQWCSAWGMSMNVGPKKTAVLALINPTDRGKDQFKTENLPVITLANGETVPYCAEYKYLGCKMTTTMGTDSILKDYIATMNESFRRFNNYNSIVNRLSPTARLQIAKTMALSGFLLCLVPWTDDTISEINKHSLIMCRRLTGMGINAPKELLWLAAGIPSAEYIIARERVRLITALQSTQHQDAPAARVFRAVGAGRGTWRYETEAAMGRAQAIGARTPRAIFNLPMDREFPEHMVGAVAAAAAREHAAAALAQGSRAAVTKALGGDQPYTTMSQPFITGPPARNINAILFGFEYKQQANPGTRRATPVSSLTIGGAGMLIQRVNVVLPREITLGITMAWQGAAALAWEPLGPQCMRLPPPPPPHHQARRQR